MSSDNIAGVETEVQTGRGVMHRLLDPAFGFFVWAGHLLVVYITEAVACQLGLEFRDARVHSAFVAMLAIATVLAAAVVLAHGFRRWKHRGEAGDSGFLIRIAAGDDAVAALAILWQLFPLFMDPICR
jgi:hypothetical protein